VFECCYDWHDRKSEMGKLDSKSETNSTNLAGIYLVRQKGEDFRAL